MTIANSRYRADTEVKWIKPKRPNSTKLSLPTWPLPSFGQVEIRNKKSWNIVLEHYILYFRVSLHMHPITSVGV